MGDELLNVGDVSSVLTYMRYLFGVVCPVCNASGLNPCYDDVERNDFHRERVQIANEFYLED